MEKWNLIYLYSGLWFDHKQEWSVDMCYHMHEPWKHDAEWEKPNATAHMLYESIYIKNPEKANF